MTQCNNEKTADMIYDLFEEKLNEFDYMGARSWGNPYESMILDTYRIKGVKAELFSALVQWGHAVTREKNRQGVISTLPNMNQNTSLGQISEVTIPLEFSKRFNTRAYEENGVIEIRNYGRFTVGRAGLKKDDFFEFVRERNNPNIYYDEENKPYIKVFEIKNGDISKEDFADSLIDFTLLVKAYKDKYRGI